jgi:asparagine synthase (glutamine-hydrolysing)
MCGIAGACNTVGDLDPETAGRVAAMTQTLRHRGPDDGGTYEDSSCGFGHRRLRIIDVSDRARQPMQTADGSIVVMLNGEIYNYRALRTELEDRYRFRSMSDTEVLLHGYAAWGTDVFSRLNGMFAIAVWEPLARRLVLARDRLGKKPLFYHWTGDGVIVFGSELKAVLAQPSVPRRLDQRALAAYLTFGYVPTPDTIFQDVYKVPQGGIASFVNRDRVVSTYWRIPDLECSVRESDAIDELDALITDAVRVRLESDVPLGFFLSGGVDSTLVAAIGKKLAGEIQTFCVGFRDRAFDEAPRARAIAQHLGTRHTELYLDQADFAAFADESTNYFDEPYADASLIATYHLSKVTRQHVTVALSGDGGDELFCGYERYQQLVRTLPVMRLPNVLRTPLAELLKSIPHDKARKIGSALQSSSVAELGRWLVSIWKPDELADLLPAMPLAWENTQLAQTWKRFQHRDELSQLMAADISSYLVDDILQKVDRASMAVGLEMRAPLLDYRVVELAMRLPSNLKYRGGTTKYLLRKLLARYVPSRLFVGPKRGLNVPLCAWYRGPRRDAVTDAIRELDRRLPNTLSVDVMARTADEHFAGRSDYSRKLFALEMLGSWIEKYQVA